MTIKTTTHLNFRGDARGALGFYQTVFGGDLTAITYAEAHAVTNRAEADLIIWGQGASSGGFHVMAFDVPSARDWHPGRSAFFVSVRGDDADTLTGYWAKLSVGGTVLEPLGPSGFSPLYGMIEDVFGVTWVFDLQVASSAA